MDHLPKWDFSLESTLCDVEDYFTLECDTNRLSTISSPCNTQLDSQFYFWRAKKTKQKKLEILPVWFHLFCAPMIAEPKSTVQVLNFRLCYSISHRFILH